MTDLRIAYYVSGHGLGHAVRSASIIDALPESVEVVVRSPVPEAFFAERLARARKFSARYGEFDCGCIQRDSLTILPRETLDAYRQISARNEASLNDEAAFLSSAGINGIVSDIAAFPLRAAKAAGVLSIAISNFTWSDIYEPFAADQSDCNLIAEMNRDYGCANLAIELPMALDGMWLHFQRVKRVGYLTPPAADRRGELQAWAVDRIGLESERKIALLYFGVWDTPLDWSALAEMKEWLFLAHHMPDKPPANVIRAPEVGWRFPELISSVDVVVAKTGYATIAECLTAGAPLVYLDRPGMAEHAAVAAAIECRGTGLEMPIPEFSAGHWARYLESAAALRQEPLPAEICAGAAEAARIIVNLIGSAAP